MELTGNTILITGGSSGIGSALAERFLRLGNAVIITGRCASALEAFAAKHPGVQLKVSDAGNSASRSELAEWAARELPKLNVLINNAGVQRQIDLQRAAPWEDTAQELEINLHAPIHLAQLFIPQLSKKPNAQLMNVSSGLAFVPIARLPLYCATKAALHSFTMSLRAQLEATSIRVTEIIPPAVKTNLGGSHDFGEELADYADSVLEQLARGLPETTFGSSARTSQMSRVEADQTFARLNGSR